MSGQTRRIGPRKGDAYPQCIRRERTPQARRAPAPARRGAQNRGEPAHNRSRVRDHSVTFEGVTVRSAVKTASFGRLAVGVGVLAGALIAASGGVVNALDAQAATAQLAAPAAAAAAPAPSVDVPLLNAALDARDVRNLTSRSAARAALADGEGVAFVVVADGERHELTSAAPTLADALTEAGIVVGWEDAVDADLSVRPTAGATVTIQRGTTEVVTEDVTTPHASETRETSSLDKGETRVVQQGVDGRATVTSQVRLVDGEEVARTQLVSVELAAATTEIIEVGTRVGPAKLYTLGQFMSAGVINWSGYKFTYYSQQVLPGGGLSIPGRHVNADGYVADADGYIVLANSAPKGTVINTPFGYQGKVYDRGTSGNHYDVYIR